MTDDLREAIGALKAQTSAAHKRVDRLETDLRDDLKGINEKLSHIDSSLNRGKGWAGAGLLLVAVFSSCIGALVAYVLGAK